MKCLEVKSLVGLWRKVRQEMGVGDVWVVGWGVIERSKFALFEVIIKEFKIWEKIILCVL